MATILVVDDEPQIRDLLAKCSTMRHYKTLYGPGRPVGPGTGGLGAAGPRCLGYVYAGMTGVEVFRKPRSEVPMDTIVKEPQADVASLEPTGRPGFVLLQALVTIVLSYQLLFSQETILTVEARQLLIAGLLSTVAVLALLPAKVMDAGWFTGLLVVADTAITSITIYVSGNASSDLYVTYFLIILIAAFSTSQRQFFGLSVILCAVYGLILYVGFGESSVSSEGLLLRVPVLLIMAVFYGTSVGMVRKERRQKAGLIDYIAALKQAEEERERLIRQLQEALANIKTLHGLLPICCSCKQIRDDQGYWSQIETYITAHTETEFTHGICPACAKKLYPDFCPDKQ